MKRVLPLVCALVLSACGSSPTSPTNNNTNGNTTNNTPTPTRIISVAGNLSFGNVNIGSTVTSVLTISNSGNAALTFTSLTVAGGTGATGFSASPLSGTVAAGGSLPVTVAFMPTVSQFYSGVLNVTSDSTSGNNAININGTGVDTSPLFTMTGVGNTIFNIPAKVTKLHITGTYTANSSNFVVWAGTTGTACGVVFSGNCSLLVNDLVGTGWGKTVSDGIYATGGRTVITTQDSDGVSWSMTEVR